MMSLTLKEAQDQWKSALEVSASWASVVNHQRDAWKAARSPEAALKARQKLQRAQDQWEAAKAAEIAAWSMWVDAKDQEAA